MHKVLTAICNELDQLVAQLKSEIPSEDSFNVAHNNWSFPGVSKADLVEMTAAISNLLRERGSDSLGGNDARINDYVRRLQFLRTNTVAQIWGSPATAVPAYTLTLDALRRAIEPVLMADPHADVALRLKRVVAQVRAMEARLAEYEPRSADLASMVKRIEQAYEAADQLPTDLALLAEDREKIRLTRELVDKDRIHVAALREAADLLDQRLKQSGDEATAVIARCQSAYSAATSQGLAAAFTERSKALDRSMWIWVGGLVLTLGLGATFGSKQLHDLTEIMKSPVTSWPLVILNLLLALMSVGAPIWFGWLATKQVGQRFRLSEDYAFKASISRAYEGYRQEAARIDKDLEVSLLASALSRLDEQPLRLVESSSHGSPWHELLASDTVKDAVKSVPGFANRVTDLAKTALEQLKPVQRNAITQERTSVQPP